MLSNEPKHLQKESFPKSLTALSFRAKNPSKKSVNSMKPKSGIKIQTETAGENPVHAGKKYSRKNTGDKTIRDSVNLSAILIKSVYLFVL